MFPSLTGARRSLSLAVLLLLVLTTALAVSGCCSITGCNLFDNNYHYDSSYTVTVTGLGNYTGSEGFRILVPIPLLSGEPGYTADQVSSARLLFPPPVSVFADYKTTYESRLVNNTGWTASLVSSEYGPMIALSSGNASLSDILLTLGQGKEVPASEREKYTDRRPGESPLYPRTSDAAGSYTVPASYSYGNYSSYVSIDGTMTPGQGVTAGNISVSVEYSELLAEGSVPVFRRSCQINESIPPGVTGWIPVTVQKTG